MGEKKTRAKFERNKNDKDNGEEMFQPRMQIIPPAAKKTKNNAAIWTSSPKAHQQN